MNQGRLRITILNFVDKDGVFCVCFFVVFFNNHTLWTNEVPLYVYITIRYYYRKLTVSLVCYVDSITQHYWFAVGIICIGQLRTV